MRRQRLHYLWAFLGGSATSIFVVHFVGNNLPWWPHSFAIGGVLGAVVAFVSVRLGDHGAIDED